MWKLVVKNQFCMVYCKVLYFMKIYQAYDIDYLPVHNMLLFYLKKTQQLESVTVKQ